MRFFPLWSIPATTSLQPSTSYMGWILRNNSVYLLDLHVFVELTPRQTQIAGRTHINNLRLASHFGR